MKNWKGAKCPQNATAVEYRQNQDIFVDGSYIGRIDSDGDIRISDDAIDSQLVAGYDDEIGESLLQSIISDCDCDADLIEGAGSQEFLRACEKYGVLLPR